MKLPKNKYISNDYLIQNPTWDREDSPWKAQQVISLMRKNGLTPSMIAEVGCGAGGVLAELRLVYPGAALFGYDIAPDASRFWSQYNSLNIHFTVGDFLKLDNQHFDVLLLLDVIEHVPDPFDFLSRLHGRATYYIFHIPLDLSVLSVLREQPLLHVRSKVGHIHYFTKGLAISMLEETGYTILDWYYTGAAYTTPQGSWKTRLAAFPRYLVSAVCRDAGVRLFGGETLMVLAQVKG